MIFIDPNGALMTHYVDENYNVILQTNDGSDDVVMVPNNRRQEFDKEVKWYNSCGYLNNPTWNQYWKDELGLAGFQFSEEALRVLDQFNSKWARNNAARFLLKPTFWNAIRMSFSEATSQWTNPELLLVGAKATIVGLNTTARMRSEVVFVVTENGVVLPKGANIPKHYVQNPYRKGSYGIIKDGVFHEKLRIDAATPKGKKGSNVSHIHVNGSGHHKTKWDF